MKFTEVNPETSKIWSRPEMFAALMEARTDRDEALAALAAFAAATGIKASTKHPGLFVESQYSGSEGNHLYG